MKPSPQGWKTHARAVSDYGQLAGGKYNIVPNWQRSIAIMDVKRPEGQVVNTVGLMNGRFISWDEVSLSVVSLLGLQQCIWENEIPSLSSWNVNSWSASPKEDWTEWLWTSSLTRHRLCPAALWHRANSPRTPHVTYTFIFLWNCGITHVSQEEHTHRTGNRFSWFILLSHLSPGLTGGGARATGPLLKTGDLAANSSNIEVSRTVEQLVTARYWLPTRPAWRAPAAASTDPSDV